MFNDKNLSEMWTRVRRKGGALHTYKLGTTAHHPTLVQFGCPALLIRLQDLPSSVWCRKIHGLPGQAPDPHGIPRYELQLALRSSRGPDRCRQRRPRVIMCPPHCADMKCASPSQGPLPQPHACVLSTSRWTQKLACMPLQSTHLSSRVVPG